MSHESKELQNELTETIRLLEAQIPANPVANESIENGLRKELKKYFKHLDDAVSIEGLERIYYRNVSFEEAMTPAKWKAEYKDGIPHWAKDKKASLFAEDFAKSMKSHKVKSVLEIGCGNGRDSILFAKSGFEATAIDIVPKAVDLAKSNATKANVDVDFRVANAEKLPFDDSSFGAVFSLSVLHSSNLKKSFAEIYRVMNKGGFAFIYIYGDTQFEDKKTEDTIKWTEYLDLLRNIGFKVTKSYTENETEYDEFGEKHKIFVTYLEK